MTESACVPRSLIGTSASSWKTLRYAFSPALRERPTYSPSRYSSSARKKSCQVTESQITPSTLLAPVDEIKPPAPPLKGGSGGQPELQEPRSLYAWGGPSCARRAFSNAHSTAAIKR